MRELLDDGRGAPRRDLGQRGGEAAASAAGTEAADAAVPARCPDYPASGASASAGGR